MTKKAKATFDIKKKLMGAVAMLLVATIMMVSATYAWFTLSTAPEVKGISTTVGGNGNLEIALRESDAVPGSTVGDSMEAQAVEKANATWGNLVDLSKTEYYGTDQLYLYPAQLDLDNTGKVTNKILAVPTYGIDGRVAEVKADGTVDHTFDGTNFSDKLENATDATKRPSFGVRAIGTSSGISEEAQDFRNARSALNQKNATAKSDVEKILNDNGDGITGIIIKHSMATEQNPDTYTQDDIAVLKATATAMNTAVASIEASLKQAIEAFAKSGDSSYNTVFGEVLDLLNAETPATIEAAISGKTLPGDFAAIVGEYTALKADAASFSTQVNSLPATGTATWTQVRPALIKLLDADGIAINGKDIDTIVEDANEAAGNPTPAIGKKDAMTAYIMGIYGRETISVEIPSTDDGALRQFADFIGTYYTTVAIPSEAIGITGAPPIPANLRVQTAKNPANLPKLASTANGLSAPTGSGSADEIINDVYGYALDLWVRTNAPGTTQLQLQKTAGTDRIYSDGSSANPATLGEGSYMEFGFSNDYGEAKVKNLMNGIRLVFTDGEGNILCYGELDTDTATTEDSKVRASINLYKLIPGENDAPATKQATENLTDLQQAVAQKITVIVYLDGNTVQNDAAANAAIATTGKMNIQFKSSATLVPMENNAIKNPSETESSETESSENP